MEKQIEKNKKPRRANGDGTIKERKDGRFEFQAVIGMAGDGSYIRKSFYGKNPTAAKTAYKTYLKDNPIPLEKVKTMKDWAPNWLTLYKKGKVTDGTYYEYEIIVNNIVSSLGHLKLPEIRPAHIEKLMRTQDSLSASRQKKIVFIIKAILQAALENHYVRENVAFNVKPPKEVKKEIQIFSRADIKKLLELNHTFSPFAKFMFFTGLRRGELLALSWRDVDTENGVIHITKALSDGEIKDKTKGKKDRIIPISRDLKEVLDIIPRGDCFNIFSVDNRPMTTNQFNHKFRSFVKASGVEYKSPHKCRHSFATYLLNSGVNIHVVQELMGHADMTMTEKYTHVNPDNLKRNIRKLKY